MKDKIQELIDLYSAFWKAAKEAESEYLSKKQYTLAHRANGRKNAFAEIINHLVALKKMA